MSSSKSPNNNLTDPIILLDGLAFPESPLIDKVGAIWCTEIMGGTLVRLFKGQMSRYSVGEKINGVIIDANDLLYFTDSGKNQVCKFNYKTDEVTVLIDNVAGTPIYRPNDLCFDSIGNLLVTCHAEGRRSPNGYLISQSTNGEVKKISTNKYFPNGIAFSADGQTLYFSETYKQRIWKASWNDLKAEITHEEPWIDVGGPLGQMAFVWMTMAICI